LKGPATWDGQPRCQLADGEDVAAKTAMKCLERRLAYLMQGRAGFFVPTSSLTLPGTGSSQIQFKEVSCVIKNQKWVF
jgi:hypothetical protein